MTNFKDLGLSDELVKSLERLKITIPTPVQTATIPPALEGKDILASAQTGSGKTVAYSIPLLLKMAQNPKSLAVILTPTRELAVQVEQMLKQILGFTSPLKTVLLIGGASMSKQMSELRRRPRLIVGTPGRINDHLERRSLALDETRFLVIDEADRMLDMGFGVQLDRIAGYLPKERQTLMFSATLPPNIEKLTKKYLQNPERVSIGTSVQAAPKIKQEVIHTKSSSKFSQLQDQLNQREGSIIIFVKTRRGAERLSRELQEHGHNTDAIHGDLQQRKRDRVILGFRNRRSRILVATDVAARGLDIPHVMHVINYDLPQAPEDYIHRIGRTARAGAEGNAVCFVGQEDGAKWRAIVRLMDPEMAKKERAEQQSRPQQPRTHQPRGPRGPHQPRGQFGFKKKSFKGPRSFSKPRPR